MKKKLSSNHDPICYEILIINFWSLLIQYEINRRRSHNDIQFIPLMIFLKYIRSKSKHFYHLWNK